MPPTDPALIDTQATDPHLQAVREAIAPAAPSSAVQDPQKQAVLDQVLAMGRWGAERLTPGQGAGQPVGQGQGRMAQAQAPAQQPVQRPVPRAPVQRGQPKEDPWGGVLNKITWKAPDAFATPTQGQIPVMSVLTGPQYAKLVEISRQHGLNEVPYVFDVSQLDERQLAMVMRLKAANEAERATRIEQEQAAKEKGKTHAR